MGHFAGQFANLAAMEEEFAGSEGFVVGNIALFVRVDVTSDKKELSVLEASKGVLEGCVAVAEALHFGPLEDDSGLEFLDQFKLEAGPTIGDSAICGLFPAGHGLISDREVGR